MWLYYDTEATGLCHPFDQAQQIAAIITSKKWQQFDSLNLQCRLKYDVIPSPEAVLITRQKPSDLDNKSLPSHYDMMTSYHRFLNERIIQQKDLGGDINGYVRERPITFKGHNIIKFDENVIRYNSHVTLHNPYIYMMDGCARFDTMICAQAIQIYGQDTFKFPDTDKGNTSFKLGKLCELNDIEVDASSLHDALVDVRYTIKLDKKMHECEPEIYYQMDLMASKLDVRNFVEKNKVFSYSLFHYGKPKTGTFTAVPNLSDTKRRTAGEQILWDLSKDPEEYLEMSTEDLSGIFSKSKGGNAFKMNSAPFLWAKRSDQPIMMPMHLVKDELRPTQKTDDGAVPLSDEELERRADIIHSNPDFVKRLNEALAMAQNSVEYDRSPYAQEWIYEGFPDKQLKEWMTRFHRSDWPTKMVLLEGFRDKFSRQIEENDSYRRYLYFGIDLVLENAPRHLIDAKPGWLKIERDILAKKKASELSTTQYIPKGMDNETFKMTLPYAVQRMGVLRDEIVNPSDEKHEESLKAKYSYNDKREILPLIDAWLKWYEKRIIEAKNYLNLGASNDNATNDNDAREKRARQHKKWQRGMRYN